MLAAKRLADGQPFEPRTKGWLPLYQDTFCVDVRAVRTATNLARLIQTPVPAVSDNGEVFVSRVESQSAMSLVVNSGATRSRPPAAS